MKIKSVMTHLFIMFFLPLCAGAQEAEEVTTVTQGTGAAQDPGMLNGLMGTASVWINRIIGYVAQIGNLFGDATGFRIGGTTGTAIITLIIAKLVEDKAPSWVKGALYITGGTMFAGSGANIVQLISNHLG